MDKDGNQTRTVEASSLADRILTIRSLASLLNVTISFAAGGGSGTMESESFSSGTAYTLPQCGFIAPTGMKFKAWKVGDDATEYQPGAEISVTTDTVITAVWEDITYKITYAAGEGSGTMDSDTAIWGTAFTLPDCTFTAPSAGYEFKAWLIGGAEYAAGGTYTFTEDTAVTAVWQIATSGPAMVIDSAGTTLGRYSSVGAAVTVAEANNGSTLKLMEAVTLDSPIYIESGTFTVDINGQSVTVSNSVFNVSGTAAITFTDTADSKGLVTSNSSGLTAAIRVYGGTAVIQNGVYVGPSSVLVTNNGTATINGGTFNNKLYNDGGTLTVNDTAAQDVTIENSTVAVDTIVSGGAITKVSFNGGTLSFKNHPNPAGIEVYYNASVTEIPLPSGYQFVDSSNTVTTAFTVGQTYTIRTSGELHTVTFDANGGSSSMNSVITAGEYTLPDNSFTAPEHYTFKAWQIGNAEYAPGESITVSADVAVKAVWKPVTYTVSFNSNGGGSTMDIVSVDYGAAYTLPECTFTAPDGKEFREWLSGNVRYAPGDQITITGDTLVAAVWDTASFDIIFDANGGSGTMTTDEVNYGTAYYVLPSCAFTAPEGQQFKAWNVNGTEYQPGETITVSADTTVTAVWKDIPAKLCFCSISLKGNIAINYYMLLSDEVLADETAYMQFTMADGEVIQIPVSEGVETLYNGETYYVFSCAVNAKEMTDDVISQFFYEGGSTAAHTYNVQTYANHILANSDDEAMKELVKAMLNYGAASQTHFGYNTDNMANAQLATPDYTNVTIEGFNATAGQGTDLAKLYSASLILKSETTLRFFFQVDASVENFTVTYNGQALEVKQRSGLYYVDVVGISAKDLDEDVTITINDGTNTAEVSFNPMSYCQGVLNDTTGAFGQDMKDLVAALYLYNQAANVYFKES